MEVNLRYLAAAEMIGISSRWIGAERALLESVEKLKPFLPDMEKAHHALVQAGPPTSALEDISVEEREVDNRHDHLLRCLYFAHAAYREYLLGQEIVDEAHVEQIEQSSIRMMPEGLAGVKAGYLAEAGNTERAVTLAATDETIKKSLDEIRITKDVDGHAILGLWGKAGTRLGELERNKAAVLAGDGQPTDTATVAKARKGWIRVVSTVMDILDHVTDSAETVEILRRSVVEPAEKAAQRYAATRKAKSPPAQEPT